MSLENRGVRFARATKLTPGKVALGQRLIDEGKSAREVAKMFNLHADVGPVSMTMLAASAARSRRHLTRASG